MEQTKKTFAAEDIRRLRNEYGAEASGLTTEEMIITTERRAAPVWEKLSELRAERLSKPQNSAANVREVHFAQLD
jgi:hypothetical protein